MFQAHARRVRRSIQFGPAAHIPRKSMPLRHEGGCMPARRARDHAKALVFSRRRPVVTPYGPPAGRVARPEAPGVDRSVRGAVLKNARTPQRERILYPRVRPVSSPFFGGSSFSPLLFGRLSVASSVVSQVREPQAFCSRGDVSKSCGTRYSDSSDRQDGKRPQSPGGGRPPVRP
jgi:hypothetical protein